MDGSHVGCLNSVMMSLHFRRARLDDAEKVALLHADSWRRHYRGAYADSFLDGDVVADRLSVWSARLSAPANSATIVVEDDSGMAGFVHVVFDDDDRWGSLIDNLHVTSERRRTGLGTALLSRAGQVTVERSASGLLYLWVLEQNTAAQQFYAALGGTVVEKAPLDGPPEKINGSPNKLRVAWPDASQLLSA